MIPFAIIKLDLSLALRNIVRQRRRSSIAIIAIGFGVVAMLLASGYMEWILWATREKAIADQYGHLQVVRPNYHTDAQADPFAFLLPSSSPALTVLKHSNGVRSVVPRLYFNGLVSHGEDTLSFIGEGIDPVNDGSIHSMMLMQGKWLAPDDPDGILMGNGLAANLGVKAGDTVVLLTSTSTGGINAVEGHVRGLVSSAMKKFDDSVLRVNIEMANRLMRAQGAHVWITTLERTDMTDTVASQLQKHAVFKHYEIVPWMVLADSYIKTRDLFARQMGLVILIISIIIILSISNTMTMSVLERTVEIGTSMALGLRRWRILALFLLEGVLLGLFGGLAGVAVGYVAAESISSVGIPMPPAPGMSRGFSAEILVTPAIMGEAMLLALVTTLLASIYPAWRASRLNIVDALRHNR